jgi:hypothetical protein
MQSIDGVIDRITLRNKPTKQHPAYRRIYTVPTGFPVLTRHQWDTHTTYVEPGFTWELLRFAP